jgi:hypothetical protein
MEQSGAGGTGKHDSVRNVNELMASARRRDRDLPETPDRNRASPLKGVLAIGPEGGVARRRSRTRDLRRVASLRTACHSNPPIGSPW